MPIVNKSYIGKGICYANGRDMGNVSELTFSINENTIELPNYRSAGGGLYNSLRRIQSVQMAIAMRDFNADNLSMALFGTVSAVAAGAVADESIGDAPNPFTRDHLLRTANMIDTSQSVTVEPLGGGVAYTEGTDWEKKAAGILLLSDGGIAAGASLQADYTKKAFDLVEALTTSAQEYELVFDGLNEAQSGTPVVVVVYRAKFGGGQGLGLIADEFGIIQLNGDVLADTAIVAGGESQYFKAAIA